MSVEPVFHGISRCTRLWPIAYVGRVVVECVNLSAVRDDLFGPLAPCCLCGLFAGSSVDCVEILSVVPSAGGPYEVGVLPCSQSAGFLGAVFDGQ